MSVTYIMYVGHTLYRFRGGYVYIYVMSVVECIVMYECIVGFRAYVCMYACIIECIYIYVYMYVMNVLQCIAMNVCYVCLFDCICM